MPLTPESTVRELTGTAFSILLFYTQIHFLHANGWWWARWMTCDIHMLCAQKHSFPTASLKGSCSSNVQRLTLTTLWCWKLDMTVSLGWSSLEEGEARGFPEIQWQYLLSPGVSPISKAPHSPTLKPFFQLQTFPYLQTWIHRKSLPLLPASRRASSTSFPVTELLAIGYPFFYPFLWSDLDCQGILSAL